MSSPALHDLLIAERDTILAECEARVLRFGGSLASHPPVQGWAIFYDDLVEVFNKPLESSVRSMNTPPLIDLPRVDALKSRSAHANELVASGYTIAEVVFSYGIISEAIAELALKAQYVLSPFEHIQVNRLLATVIAAAVTVFEYEVNRIRDLREAERIGTLAHELRNSLQAATIALEMIGTGMPSANSMTSDGLQQNLQRMGELIDKTLTEVRLRVEPQVHLVSVPLVEVISEIATISGFVARNKGISLVIEGHYDLVVLADRQLILAVLSNLVQNALKYSIMNATIRVVAARRDDTIVIEVEDQCGGLPAGAAEEMFKPFVQRSSDRSGLGLGLTISQDAIIRCKGKLTVRDLPGHGCVFTVELPAGQPQSTDAHVAQYA